jgi:hypothetical protein
MTTEEKVERLGTIGGHFHLTPELHAERARLDEELFAEGHLSDIDRFRWKGMINGFNFVDPKHEAIYSAAYHKQLSARHK